MFRFIQLCGFLILAAALFSISAVTFPDSMQRPERPAAAPTPTPAPAIVNPDEPDHATIEYGTPEVIKNNNDPIHAYIRFPQGGNSTDVVISEWAQGVFDNFYTEFQSVLLVEPAALGEINVHFDSYLVDNRYAGIFESGEFSYALSIPPEVVVKTFNINLETRTFLDSTDILDYSQSDIFLPLLRERMIIEHPQTESHLAFIDESWLNHLVIGHEGIIVVLEKYMQLPEAFDTLAVTLPYDDLGAALLIRTEPPLAAPPGPDPEETEPDPAHHEENPGEHEDTDDQDEQGDEDDADDTGDTDDEDEEEQDDTDESDEPEEHGSTGDPIPDVPPQSDNFDHTKPIIVLSFDDGPSVYTDQFLDLFAQYNIRATFCTIGNLVNTQTEALARAVSMGSEVIGHSWNHKNLAKLSAEDVKKQLVDTSDAIEAATGTRVAMFRPPYGAVSDTMKEVAAELGYTIIYWSVDPEDWNTKDSDAVYNAVMQHVKNGSIVLSHEIYKSTLEAYKRIIPELLAQGYQFLTVSEMLQFKYGNLTPGHVYYDGYDG